MGLKFQREDSLDKLFENFAFLPEEEEKEQQNKDLERFLDPQPKEKPINHESSKKNRA